MEIKVDRRIIKTQNIIQSTFLDMLIKNGFDKITVKEIAEKSNISRKTFYLHYIDKYDLLDSIVNQHLKELDIICELKKNKGYTEGTIIWFNYFDQHKVFFSALFASESTGSFRKQLLGFMMNQLSTKIKTVNPEKDIELLQKFLSMAVLGIIESFLLNEINASTERIARQVGELLEQNIILASK